MELTPIDIAHIQFKRSLRGYNLSQVDEFKRKIADVIEGYVSERAELHEQVELLTKEVSRCREIENAMNSALILAQKTADELKANAHKEADLILREADQSIAQKIADAREELADLNAQLRTAKEHRDKFESDFRALIRSCADWLDRQSPAEPSGEIS